MIRHRRAEPGTTYLITKKCSDDLFLIVPSTAVNQILLYTLIFKAIRYGVLIHGFCFLSNHFHLVVTDIRGDLPSFLRDFLSNSSKALMVQLKERRPIWSRKRYSDVKLLDLDAAERKIAYTILNPTRARIVAYPWDWPGLNSVRWTFGERITALRPDSYFSKRYAPEEVSIELAPLCSVFGEEDGFELSASRISRAVLEDTETIRRQVLACGARFAGAKRARGISRMHQGSYSVRTRIPRFSSRNPLLLQQAIEDEREFEEKYEKAKLRYKAGLTRTLFPSGTYGYRVLLGVRVAQRAA